MDTQCFRKYVTCYTYTIVYGTNYVNDSEHGKTKGNYKHKKFNKLIIYYQMTQVYEIKDKV